jgi:uncharacterized membrane protein
MKLLGFTLVMVGVNILGVMALLVGLLVSVPVTTLAYIYVYRKLSYSPTTEDHTETPVLTAV